MDIPRTSAGTGRLVRKTLYVVVGLGAMLLATFALAKLKPAAPGVSRSTVWTDTVKRGQMLRQVRGPGTLVPEQVRQVAAPVEGRVERVFSKPGERVTAGTVLVELSNPSLRQRAVDVEYQIKSAEADLNDLRSRLQSGGMGQQAAAAKVQSEYSQAKIELDTDEQLAREGLVPALTLRVSRVKVAELESRLTLERKRVEADAESAQAQVAAQRARVEQLQAQLRLNQEQVASLQVRAGTDGVLQEVSVEVGQQITPGTDIARVADPSSLKAVIQIPETQVRDVALGQQATIDTRGGGVVAGRVQRIDPAARSGAVTVDVKLEGALPQAARPDLGVDGTVELERLDGVLYMGRPAAGGGAQSELTLFLLEADGRGAVRVPVKLGRASVSTVEVLEGLREGDTVILSDTSQWDGTDRLKLD